MVFDANTPIVRDASFMGEQGMLADIKRSCRTDEKAACISGEHVSEEIIWVTELVCTYIIGATLGTG